MMEKTGSKPRWTISDVKILKLGWRAGADYHTIAAALAKTPASVQCKVHRMRRVGEIESCRQKYRRFWGKWTYPTDETLIDLWNNKIPLGEIEAAVGHSKSAIFNRINTLKNRGNYKILSRKPSPNLPKKG